MKCKHAQKVWKLIDLYGDIKQLAQQDMPSALQELATKGSKNDVELIIVVCWSNWYSRNL